MQMHDLTLKLKKNTRHKYINLQQYKMWYTFTVILEEVVGKYRPLLAL